MASSYSPKTEFLALQFAERRKDPTKSSSSLMAQIEHRRALVSFWDIQPNSRVLEIGCGQGDTTVVLADAVKENGHVVAVDPGALDYGSPFTLSQAQSHISSSPLGPKITFHTPCNPLDHLASLPESSKPTYDYAILSHSIFYFSSPSILPSLINALIPHVKKICIAEWSLTSSSPTAFPHVLTALLRSYLEAKLPPGCESHNNIRTVLSPSQIKKIVLNDSISSSFLELVKEEIVHAPRGMQDAYWEVSDILRERESEMKMLRENGVDEKEISAIESMFDGVELAVEGLVGGGAKGVECMDVWVGIFEVV